jgi:hypothetical protein
MKQKKWFALLLILFLCPEAPRSSDLLLVRIERAQPPGIMDESVQQFRVVQELETCWIAQVPTEEFAAFRQAGGAGQVLDAEASAHNYFLATGVQPEQAQALGALGTAIQLETGLFLFWSETESFWDSLPDSVHLKSIGAGTPLRISFAEAPAAEIQETESAPDPAIASLVAAVSKDNLASSIRHLQDFQTRRITTTNCEAAGTYIHDTFAAQGLDTAYDPFSFFYQSASGTTRNVIATLPGKTDPSKVVLIGAHYDSTSNLPLILAPGADDNASGSAAVMEIARIMRTQLFDYTVRFACFSAEEIGLIGSRHYASEAVARGESILAMIDLDMIGFAAKQNEDLDIIANAPSAWLADLFLSAAGTYTSLPVIKAISPSVVGSDHSPFWDQGYSAVMAIENYPLMNPYYHKTSDTIDTLDLDFAANATRAALATASILAQPTSTPLVPSNLTARSETVRSLFRRLKNVVLTWQNNDTTVTGYNVYRATGTTAGFAKTNATPLRATEYVDRYLPPDQIYSYMVTAVDAKGRESRYSRQVSQ